MGGLGNLLSMFKNLFGGGGNPSNNSGGEDNDSTGNDPNGGSQRHSGYEAEIDGALGADEVDAGYKRH